MSTENPDLHSHLPEVLKISHFDTQLDLYRNRLNEIAVLFGGGSVVTGVTTVGMSLYASRQPDVFAYLAPPIAAAATYVLATSVGQIRSEAKVVDTLRQEVNFGEQKMLSFIDDFIPILGRDRDAIVSLMGIDVYEDTPDYIESIYLLYMRKLLSTETTISIENKPFLHSIQSYSTDGNSKNIDTMRHLKISTQWSLENQVPFLITLFDETIISENFRRQLAEEQSVLPEEIPIGFREPLLAFAFVPRPIIGIDNLRIPGGFTEGIVQYIDHDTSPWFNKRGSEFGFTLPHDNLIPERIKGERVTFHHIGNFFTSRGQKFHYYGFHAQEGRYLYKITPPEE